ncbi:MAG: PilZ domain-containing protein [Caldimicrobium sp.]
MVGKDRRYYTRYNVNLQCVISLENGLNLNGEILDLSIEGAKIRILQDAPLNVKDTLYLQIKDPDKNIGFKAKAETRWVAKENIYTIFGVKFIGLRMQDKDVISKILSEIALSQLSEIYL